MLYESSINTPLFALPTPLLKPLINWGRRDLILLKYETGFETIECIYLVKHLHKTVFKYQVQSCYPTCRPDISSVSLKPNVVIKHWHLWHHRLYPDHLVPSVNCLPNRLWVSWFFTILVCLMPNITCFSCSCHFYDSMQFTK